MKTMDELKLAKRIWEDQAKLELLDRLSTAIGGMGIYNLYKHAGDILDIELKRLMTPKEMKKHRRMLKRLLCET